MVTTWWGVGDLVDDDHFSQGCWQPGRESPVSHGCRDCKNNDWNAEEVFLGGWMPNAQHHQYIISDNVFENVVLTFIFDTDLTVGSGKNNSRSVKINTCSIRVMFLVHTLLFSVLFTSHSPKCLFTETVHATLPKSSKSDVRCLTFWWGF